MEMEIDGSSGVRIEHQQQPPQHDEDVQMKEEEDNDNRRTTNQHEFLSELLRGTLEGSQISLMDQEQPILIKQTLLNFQEEMTR